MATLRAQLRLQLAWARRNVEKRTRLDLANGLGITLYVDKLGDAHLLLTRKGRTAPGDNEAATVAKHWPEPVGAPEWKKGTSGEVTWLAATLSKPEQLPLQEGTA